MTTSGATLDFALDLDTIAEVAPDDDGYLRLTLTCARTETCVSLRYPAEMADELGLPDRPTVGRRVAVDRPDEGLSVPGDLRHGVLVKMGAPPYRPFLRALDCGFHNGCRVVVVRMPSGGTASGHVREDERLPWITAEKARDLTSEAVDHELGRAS